MPILELLILTLVLVGIAVTGLSIRLFFSRDKQFHGGSCSSSPGLKENGIGCGCSTGSCETE